MKTRGTFTYSCKHLGRCIYTHIHNHGEVCRQPCRCIACRPAKPARL